MSELENAKGNQIQIKYANGQYVNKLNRKSQCGKHKVINDKCRDRIHSN